MSRRVAVALSIPPVAFLLLFFVWPVASILATGLAPNGWLDIDAIAAAWSRPWLLDTIVFTVGLAAAITAFSLLVGLPAAWVFARFTFPGRRLLRALFAVPFVLPTVVVAAAFLALLGPRSVHQPGAGREPVVPGCPRSGWTAPRPRSSSRACSSTWPWSPGSSAACGHTSIRAWRMPRARWVPARGERSGR